MEMSMERDSSALGSLFQQIINDMKNTSPLWEDFVAKASKLHACLRAAIQAIAAYLDAFQKIADAATNSRGASKEIGTALTRVCLRHKAVETRLKTFTAAIMDCLVQPLQDKLEDWKRSVATIDKEHAKEYKRCRTELKKRSTDTLRLQKKARKGQSDTLQSLMDSHMQDVTLRRAELEEVEKKSLRSAMIEERMRYCSFVHMLQPVVKEECEVMSELGHLQEAMQSIALVTKEPQVLPAASEELIHDAKASILLYPESPSASAGGGGSLSQGGCSNSLGSRKSSVCSISSMNSSGSSNSPGHPHYPRSLSQASSINNPSHAVTTWPTHSQDTVDLPSNASERPHTISSAYEKGHQRPPLTVYTFQNPETIHEGCGNNIALTGGSSSGQNTPSTQKSPAGALTRPPLPVRCSSLERPLTANSNRGGNGTNLMQRQCPSPIPAHVTKELSAHLAQQQHQQQQLLLQQQQQQSTNQQQQQQQTSPPTYVNMSELANMAAMKITNQQQQQLQQQQQQQHSPTQPQQQQQMLQQQHSIDSISSIHSNESNTSMPPQQHQQQQQQQNIQTTPPSHQQHPSQPIRSHSSNSNTPSLHSHPSIDSTVATPPIGQTPSVSSGSSTPQNHYSPLLTNSPSSTAAGTPSGASITSSGLTTSGGYGGGAASVGGGNNSGNNFIYNICSPTPPQSANSSQASDILKITETEGNCGPSTVPPSSSSSSSNLPSQTNDMNTNISSPPPSSSANNQDLISNSNNDADSSGNVVENDERSRASVLQKASMFEKQAAAVKSTPIPPANASAGLTRNLENNSNSGIYGTRSGNNQQQQQQPPQSQSIDPQEVDSFQREIDASKQQKEHQKNVKNLYDGIDSYISNETMTIITDDNTTTIICETTQQQDLQQSQQEKDFCTASNQTNSSGCGTDISDTTSEDCNADTRSLTSQTGLGGGIVGGSGVVGRLEIDVGNGNELIGGLLKTNLKALSGGAFNSDSELSRCYISETSSIMGGCSGDGYENPTFAHFAASSSASQCYDDNRSDTLSLQRQPLYGDNISDNGSNVVVIYDHQPPITPDIDYCKQNSEIVMLRTKPAQHSQYPQEMRELQQLPDNLTEASSPTSPNGTSDHSIHQHIATVAPAKQRLSSFRASSEQLQLLNSSPTAAATTKAATSTTTFTSSISSSTSSPSAATPLNNSCNPSSSCNSETIIHKKLPPKPPSLTVFQTNQHTEVNNNNSNKNSKLLQNSPKLDFKSDLEAKILKQKEKLKKQQENEKQQQQTQLTTLQSCSGTTSTTQQQQQLQQNHHNSNNSINCNSSSIINKINSLENSSLSCTPSSSSSSLASHSNNHNHSNTNHIPSSSSNNNHELPLKHILNSQHLNSHIYSKTNLTAHAYKTSTTTTTNMSSSPSIVSSSLSSSSSPPALRNSVMSSASLNVICTPPLPPPLPLTNTITTHSSNNRNDAGGSMLCNNNHNDHNNHTTIPAPSLLLANVAKPSITPRPASLSGSTRIARRSSVNTAKPPPPVRRSSSVTPSPNTPTTPTNANATNMLHHQQAHSLNTSTENLPPPPAYLLEARQTTPTTPPSAMPNSSQKVSETVKALSGLRHQPASPHTLRRLQQQQQQQQHHQQHQSMLQSPLHQHYNQQHNIYSPTITTPTSPIILPMHDEPEYDAYYNTYVEVPTTSFIADKDNSLFITPTKTNPNANVALTLNNAIPSNKIISPIYQQPPKQYQHQYTKSSPVLMSPPTPTSTTKRTTTPTPPTPLSPQNAVTALHQMDFDDIPPPLPPPNPNHHHPQLSLPLRYQQQLPTPNSNNNHMPSSQQMQKQHQQQHNHHHNQQQQQYHEQLQQLDYNNGEALYGTNSPTSFRTSSPGGGIYAQPKILNNMSSFRTNSPGPNGHQTPTTSSTTTTQSHVPAQPKTNPNLIAQLNARLNSSKQQNTNEAIYGVTTVNHQQQQHHQREEIYMRNYQQQQQQQQHQQQQMSTHASQPPQQLQQQQTYDAAHQQHPSHQQQQSQKVANVATNNAQQMRQSSSHQTLPMSQMSPMPPSTEQATAAHQQQSHYQIGSHHHHQQQLQQQQHTAQHYTCPPPLEDPPPPPIHNANNNSATMPKRGSSSHHHHHNHNQQQSVNLATYAAASSASTLPKNMIQQQRILQQQQQQHQGIYGTATHQAQQQQYHAPAAISAGHPHAQQYQNPQHISQRPPMPLPHHQQQQPQQQQPHPQHQQQSSSTTGNRHKTATINATKQPPVPSRHSSVQQKIFVATNPFIQTTTIHCHSPNGSSVHSQPASPVCNSPTPSSVASIYGTSSRRSSGSGSSVVASGGMSHYDVSGGGNNAGAVYYNHQLNTAPNTNYTSTNVDKTTSIRSKAKAEFLENLNAKLAKQSLSGRAFAVRNLINSKALPDPRICHESLMDQIKRGATLKRNQKINDRSAPKIY